MAKGQAKRIPKDKIQDEAKDKSPLGNVQGSELEEILTGFGKKYLFDFSR